LEWLDRGLALPPEVIEASAAYRTEQDDVGRFIGERCVLRDGLRTSFRDLYSALVRWAEEEGAALPSRRAFAAELSVRGIGTRRSGHQRCRIGIGLRP
jgi:putative DNA primase/helicase